MLPKRDLSNSNAVVTASASDIDTSEAAFRYAQDLLPEDQSEFNSLRMIWLRAALTNPQLLRAGGSVAGVAWQIQYRMNREKRCAWPSFNTMAEATGLSPSTIKYAVHWLETHGWIFVDRRSGGGNRYVINLAKTERQLLLEDKRGDERATETDEPRHCDTPVTDVVDETPEQSVTDQPGHSDDPVGNDGPGHSNDPLGASERLGVGCCDDPDRDIRTSPKIRKLDSTESKIDRQKRRARVRARPLASLALSPDGAQLELFAVQGSHPTSCAKGDSNDGSEDKCEKSEQDRAWMLAGEEKFVKNAS